MSKETENRKLEHIKLCIEKDVNFEKKNGFERIKLEGTGKEISADDVDLSTMFLGKKFSYPLFIEAMTGGSPGTEKINENLAWAAEKLGIGMGVGSQRAALENPQLEYTYKVRHVAPNIFLLGNIGGVQLLGYDIERIEHLVEMIDANGLVVHLNAFQELIQPEGDKKWDGVFERIGEISRSVRFPIVVKEVGSGICGWIAKKLENAGVSAIDIAGAGGTNWLKIESYRGKSFHREFIEIGLPTAEALEQCVKSVSIPVIASGGIRSGEECVKAIAMGASLAGFALPLLKPATESGEAVTKKLLQVIDEMKEYMAGLGVKNIKELSSLNIIKNNNSFESDEII